MATLKARRLHENHFEFKPTHKLFLDTNHRPMVRSGDDALFARLHCVPFVHPVPPEECDRKLREKMCAELPGILAWIVRGAARWLAEGLDRPPEVQAATNEYQAESDPLGFRPPEEVL